jgi:hypothetical protein
MFENGIWSSDHNFDMMQLLPDQTDDERYDVTHAGPETPSGRRQLAKTAVRQRVA